MVDLTNRSYQKELLDRDDIPFEDIRQNMHELNKVNTLLGGHRITLSGVKKILENADRDHVLICEIGCGGGDNLFAIHKYCKAKNISVSFIGIDIKKECTAFAKQQYPDLPANWVTSDYRSVDLQQKNPDIIFSSLFCHHFTDDELVFQLRWMKENSARGFFINDLHRNIIAYYSIKILTKIFSGSYLVKNDAPLSVARGFTKKEWMNIFAKEDFKKIDIKWRWAFRHLIIFKHD